MNEFKEFQNYLQADDRSPLTITGYLTDVRLFIAWFEKHNHEPFALESVTPIDVREYREYLQKEQGLKANSVNRKLASIAALMRWARQSNQIRVNPTENVKPVRQTVLAPHWLDKKEQFALQRAIEKDLQVSKLRYPKRWVTRRRDASMVLFMLHTGLRLSEVASLEIRDVELSERKGSVLVRHGKGNKERSVPLNAEARQALQEWLAVRPNVKSTFLWIAVEGPADESLSGREVQRVLKRYAQDAGLDELTPHMLRHSFGRSFGRLVNASVDAIC